MRIVSTVLACVVAVGATAFAQQKPQTTTPPQEKIPVGMAAPSERKTLVPLKVQILLSRFKGEKKIGSLPYFLGLTANDGEWANLRMGIDVPIGSQKAGAVGFGISYRSVGTNIDCLAQSTTPDDLYRLVIKVEDTSVLADPSDKSSAIAGDMPAFRSFKSSFTLLLRDGQTAQHTSAVDPISGEVMKIDVTLNVMK